MARNKRKISSEGETDKQKGVEGKGRLTRMNKNRYRKFQVR